MEKEIRLNGMNKEQLLETREGLKIMDTGFEMLIEQIDRLERGEKVADSEIRAAKLKLNEGIYIFEDLKKIQSNNSKPMNRNQRRNRRG
ncbi:hypothetical protein [Sarcina ventriculi]